MGIGINATVADAVSSHRRRRHRQNHYTTIDVVIEEIRSKGLVEDEDIVLWKGKKDIFKSTFSTKDTWAATRNSKAKVGWYKGIWFSHATPKYSFLAWLATRNSLTTGDRMLSWNVGANPSCVFCQNPLENRNHLFFTCKYSKEVWSGLTRKLIQRRFSTDWETVLKTLTDMSIERDRRFLIRYIFQLTIHSIWKERNSKKHGEALVPPAILIHRLDKQIRNRISSIRQQGDRRYDGCMAVWFASR